MKSTTGGDLRHTTSLIELRNNNFNFWRQSNIHVHTHQMRRTRLEPVDRKARRRATLRNEPWSRFSAVQ